MEDESWRGGSFVLYDVYHLVLSTVFSTGQNWNGSVDTRYSSKGSLR
jgi:hypothetical protein